MPLLSYTHQFIFCALYYVVRECRFSVVLLLADGDGPGRPSIAVCKCSQLLAVIDWRQQPRIVLQSVSVISPLLCSLLTSSTVIRVAEGEYSFRSRSPSFAECHVVSLHCRTWVLSRSLTFNTLTTTAYTPYIAVGEEFFFYKLRFSLMIETILCITEGKCHTCHPGILLMRVSFYVAGRECVFLCRILN